MNLQGDEPAINIDDIINLNEQMIVNQSKRGFDVVNGNICSCK